MAVVAGMKQPNDHAEPTKVERDFFDFFNRLLFEALLGVSCGTGIENLVNSSVIILY